MTVTWKKLGRVYSASAGEGWAASHAYCPTPVALDGGDRIRVYCAFLDPDQVGRCGWVDVDGQHPNRVLDIADRPALDTGPPGAFDEHGATPLCVVPLDDGRLRLYYVGWQRDRGVRYTLFTGLAESDDDGQTFVRVSTEPVLGPTALEPHVRSGAAVRAEANGWRAWYAAGFGWSGDDDHARPRYRLRTIFSDDGISWPDDGPVCLEPRADDLGFSRSCVVRRDDLWHMWFGRRALDGAYSIGYAESRDCVSWVRRDDLAGIGRGDAGDWDDEMVGLPGHLETRYGTWLFYNGNGLGATGFGVAVADGL